MKLKIKLTCAILAVCTLFSLSGCSLLSRLMSSPKEFSTGYYTITLDNTFTESEYIGYDAYYTSATTVVMSLHEKLSDYSQYGYYFNSPKDYAEILMIANDKPDAVITTTKGEDPLTYFYFYDTISDIDYYYEGYVFLGERNAYCFQFSCEKKNAEKYHEKFEAFARSIVLK